MHENEHEKVGGSVSKTRTSRTAMPKSMRISELVDAACGDEFEAVLSEPIDSERIQNLTFAKLGLHSAITNTRNGAATGAQTGTRGDAANNTHDTNNANNAHNGTLSRVPKRFLRVAAIAAALMLATIGTAVGANYALQLTNQPIDFEPELVIHGTPVENVEVSNAAVNQTVQRDGVAVTFDTVAADDNFIVAYFTLAFDEPLDLEAAVGDPWGGDPDRKDGYDAYKLQQYLPPVNLVANGIQLGRNDTNYSFKEAAPYMPDERTVKYAVRYLIPTLLPDVFDLQASLLPSTARGVTIPALSEPADFTVAVDKSAVSAATQLLESGLYTFNTAEGVRYLDVEKLVSSPFGTVLSVRRHYSADGALDAQYLGVDNSAVNAGRGFNLLDGAGNELQSYSYSWADDGSLYTVYELVHRTRTPMPSLANSATDSVVGSAANSVGGYDAAMTSNEGAISVTIVPVVTPLDATNGPRQYSVHDIGAKIQTSATAGYYLEDYRVEDNQLIFVTRAYGQAASADYYTDFVIDDEDIVVLTENKRSAFMEQNYDPATGLYTVTISYYVTPHAQLLFIKNFWVYYYQEPFVDMTAAQTFKLAPRV